jgi:flagellin
MVVQHNMQAANANRMLNVTTGQQAKSTEKLSSGYRINRAADDAAGLTISEKMRKQIKGLDRASTNAEDGVSAVQTAEGALTEVHSMLQRMNELATQAANGTNSESDRSAIQDEISQLTTEVDRVAETTKFNETYLLKGNTDGSSSDVKVNAHDAGLAGKLTDNGDGTSTFNTGVLNVGDKITIAGKKYTIADSAKISDYADLKTTQGVDLASGDTLVREGKSYTYHTATDKKSDGTTYAVGWYENDDENATPTTIGKADLRAGDIKNGQKLVGTGTDAYAIKTQEEVTTAIKGLSAGDAVSGKDASGHTINYTVGVKDDPAQNTYTVETILEKLGDMNGALLDVNGTKTAAIGNDDGDDSTISAQEAYSKIAKELATASSIGTDSPATVKGDGTGKFTIKQGTVSVKNSLSFSLHVGADADMTNKINVDIESMSSAGLGIKGINVKDDSGIAATYAIDAIADAISKVSSQRSSLGAVQNRLEHTISNVDNVVENTTSAESRIRDTDMASEMVNYSKNNILAQAGQSMLAQANQSNQGVLSLLQ